MPERIRVALVGAGNVAESHARGWQAAADVAELCAVVDIDTARAKAKAEAWGCTGLVTASLADAVAELQPDLVDICTREHQHAPVTIEALGLGANVLTEKIMAESLSSGWAMVNEARSAQRWAAVQYNYPYFPGMKRLKAAVESGEQGPLQLLQITCHGYCFHHLVAAVLWFCGMPVRATAQGAARDWPESWLDRWRIDPELMYIPGKAMSSRLELADGAVCLLNSTMLPTIANLPFHILAVFESGQVMELTGLDWMHDMLGRCDWLPSLERCPADGQDGPFDSQLGFSGSVRDAAERLRAGRPPAFSLEFGWEVLLLEHALVVAGAEGGSVDVAELRAQVEGRLG